MDAKRRARVLLWVATALLLTFYVDLLGSTGLAYPPRLGACGRNPPDWVIADASSLNGWRSLHDSITTATPQHGAPSDGGESTRPGSPHGVLSSSENSDADSSEDEESEPDESEVEDSEGEDAEDEDERRKYADLDHVEKQKMHDESRNRGIRLLCQLQDIDNAVQSHFTVSSSLADWGWVAVDYYAMDTEQFKHNFLVQDLFRDRQFDQAVPPNIRVDWVHSADTNHVEDGRSVECPATEAEYFNIINGKDGLIIAHEVSKPRQRLEVERLRTTEHQTKGRANRGAREQPNQARTAAEAGTIE
ncbi:hypothetical protein LTR95_010711 [Oleoguttula sp. CCFEE 5521]